MSRYLYKEVEVEVDLDDFSDEELLQELKDRKLFLDEDDEINLLAEQVYWAIRDARLPPDDNLRSLIHLLTGRIV